MIAYQKYKDSGWEIRLKSALAIFMEASELCQDDRKGISIVNGVLLPCLDIIKQQSIPEGENGEKSVNLIGQQIDYAAWQAGANEHQFNNWLSSLKERFLKYLWRHN